MTLLPAGALCPQHTDVPATQLCGRCGSFFCDACARRTRPDAKPMCIQCWELRSKQVGALTPSTPSKALFNTALVLGILSLIPLPALLLGSLIVNILALVRARGDLAPQRWKPVVGLSVTLLSAIGWGLVFYFSVGTR